MSNSQFIVAIVKSFGLHIAIAVVLLSSATFSALKKPEPEVIQVQPIQSVAVDQQQLQQQINRIKSDKENQRKAEERRVKELEQRASSAQQKRRSEEQRIKDLNKKKRQSQQEKRKADAAAKKAREKQKREAAEASRLAEEAKRKRAEKQAADKAAADAKARRAKAEREEREAENKRKQREAKAKQERERKARETRERREAELELQRQMAAEQAARDRAHSKQVLSEVDKFKVLIKQRVEQGMIVDESMKGKTCKVRIQLAFNGLVTNVKVLSGATNVCSAAESAIYKVDKVPMSQDPAVFDKLKTITFTFNPEI